MGTIQTAIDVLPATGAMVLCLDGKYYIQSNIVLDSYQTLKGCGRNTIFTPTTADLDIVTATGSDGSEKEGIILADFCIDGSAGGVTNDCGIKWTYVDKSKVINTWVQNCGEYAMMLYYSDLNTVENCFLDNSLYGIYVTDLANGNIIICNTATGMSQAGIRIDAADNCSVIGNVCTANLRGMEVIYGFSSAVAGNTCSGNTQSGIYIYQTFYNAFSGNTCASNGYSGIEFNTGTHNNITGNVCRLNGRHGIDVYHTHNNAILGNTCSENSQNTDNTYDDIILDGSDYNNIQGNTCRAGDETNKPRYGINISDATCNENKVINNDLYDDGFGTAPYNDSGTGTIYKEPANYLDLPEIAEPGNPTTNNLRLFVLEDNGFSVLSFKDDGGMVRQFMRDSIFIGYNDTGSTIAADRIVYAAGSTDGVPKVALAKADSSSTMPAIGVTIDSMANGAYGRVMQIGLLEDVNTSAYSVGNILYVSAATAGVPTATAPTYPNIRQEIGTVLVDHATTGAIQIVARSAFDDAVVLESAVAFAFLLGG